MESSEHTLEKVGIRSKNLFRENNSNPHINSVTNSNTVKVTPARAHICHLLCATVQKGLYVRINLIFTIALIYFSIIIF